MANDTRSDSLEGLELKPCPFCGGEAHTCEGDGRWFVSCGACFCCVGEAYDASAMPEHLFHSEEDAVAAWNRRALTSTQDLLRQAERDLLKCAADCHRAKWQFQEGENDRPAVSRVNRAAFDALHNIGDVAINAARSLSEEIAKKIGTEE